MTPNTPASQKGSAQKPKPPSNKKSKTHETTPTSDQNKKGPNMSFDDTDINMVDSNPPLVSIAPKLVSLEDYHFTTYTNHLLKRLTLKYQIHLRLQPLQTIPLIKKRTRKELTNPPMNLMTMTANQLTMKTLPLMMMRTMTKLTPLTRTLISK